MWLGCFGLRPEPGICGKTEVPAGFAEDAEMF
jgi:hypothetical protein